MPYERAMSVAQRQAFLAEVHVAVLAIDEPGRGPLALPIWYTFDGEVIELGMDGRSRKAELLRAAGRATIVVQDESPPYRYVSVEGPVTFTDRTRDVEVAASRYLGEEIGAWYAQENPASEHTVVIHLRPEHWRTQDFSGAADEAAESGLRS